MGAFLGFVGERCIKVGGVDPPGGCMSPRVHVPVGYIELQCAFPPVVHVPAGCVAVGCAHFK